MRSVPQVCCIIKCNTENIIPEFKLMIKALLCRMFAFLNQLIRWVTFGLNDESSLANMCAGWEYIAPHFMAGLERVMMHFQPGNKVLLFEYLFPKLVQAAAVTDVNKSKINSI